MPHTEPLRDLRFLTALRANPASGVRLRTGVVDLLLVAQSLLPRAVRLLVIAGHHDGSTDTPCPHTAAHRTGGAVDLAAFVDGKAQPTPWSPTAPPDWHRVAAALTDVGMVNETTWWHWSFGDGHWQHRTGAAAPLYADC